MGLPSHVIPQGPRLLFSIRVWFALAVLLHSSGRATVVRAECGWDESHSESVRPKCDTAKYQLYGWEHHMTLCGEHDEDTDSDDYHDYLDHDDDSQFDEEHEFLHHVQAKESEHCWREYWGVISVNALANGKDLQTRRDDDDLTTPSQVCCASTPTDCCHFRGRFHSHDLEDEVYAAGAVSGLLSLIILALIGVTVLCCCCREECPDYAGYAKYRKLFNIKEGEGHSEDPTKSAPVRDTEMGARPPQYLEAPPSLMMQPVTNCAPQQSSTLQSEVRI